jgi:para-aminobenzoate synthetase component 1
MSLPFVEELRPVPSVESALLSLGHRPNVVLFESSLVRPPLGRYSFLAAEPFALFEQRQASFGNNPFSGVAAALAEQQCTAVPELPPFQGGAAGLLSYELGGCFERLPNPHWDEFQIPAMVVGIYSWVLAWDHLASRCWFISQGLPETSSTRRELLAREQWRAVQADLHQRSRPLVATEPQIPLTIAAPTCSSEMADELLSNFDHAAYLAAVERVIELICAGDVFQANLSQRLLFPAKRPALQQYLSLQKKNPAPFAGYFAHRDWAILSASPERFLQLRNGTVSTRPIKGTRQRGSVPEADLYRRDELRESEKDRAENVMIVDLLRNDLSRVCRPGSIRVPELCMVETYETVSHLVSEIQGELEEGRGFWDLIEATFPGGSITGAPKIRAMQIISELEQVARGPYCGSLFYLGFDGTADSNILIRTMTQRGGWLSFPAGGGIVAQSNPEEEYQETLHKVRGLVQSLQIAHPNR